MNRFSLKFLTVALLLSCGKKYHSGPIITNFADMPTATGPVTGSIRAEFNLMSRGRKLTDWKNSWTGQSAPMCQTGEMIIRLLADASKPDQIVCFVGAMEANGFFTPSYDGTDRYYVLQNTSRQFGRHRAAGDIVLKLNSTKSGKEITDFKMWICRTNRKTRATAQIEYVSTSLSNGTATVTSVSSFNEAPFLFAQRTVATGNFNFGGSWYSKSISNTGSFEGGSGGTAFQHRQQMTLTQGRDNFALSGYFNGYYNGSANTQTGRLYAKIQASNLSNFQYTELGYGTANYELVYPGKTSSTIRSWNSSGAPIISTQGPYYGEVSSEQPPTANAIAVPTFSSAESWNCDSGGQPVTSIDFNSASFKANLGLQGMIAYCIAKYGLNDESKTNCYSGTSFDEGSY